MSKQSGNYKVKEKTFHILFSRLFIFGILIIAECLWLGFAVLHLYQSSIFFDIVMAVMSYGLVLFIINKEDNPAYKLVWIIFLLTVPIVGAVIYLMFGNKKPSRRMRRQLNRELARTDKLLLQDEKILNQVEDKRIMRQMAYTYNASHYPAYENTTAKYFPSGEEAFEAMKEELEKAEHFIFFEYFIVQEGEMWNSLLEIMERKANQGVEVRVMYDDMGSVALLPFRYYKKLEKRKIKSVAFNPFVPFLSLVMNHRDHRKILVIDGHTGFSGGINIADEYINKVERFGYWKDTAIMLKGDAVWNMTLMFLQMWNANRKTDVSFDFYRPHSWHPEPFESDGYVQPYGDSPLDENLVGENVYLNIINNASDYVYIFTPYLIIDNEMITALCVAAGKGVDVRIVTPGIPDKKSVFLLTQSYYRQLLDAGVRIFEFTPGFIHAKCMVCDDEIATVGTINMDYRSLYLHFECGVYLYQNEAVLSVKEDAFNTIEQSKEITQDDCKKDNFTKLYQSVLKVLAPLM